MIDSRIAKAGRSRTGISQGKLGPLAYQPPLAARVLAQLLRDPIHALSTSCAGIVSLLPSSQLARSLCSQRMDISGFVQTAEGFRMRLDLQDTASGGYVPLALVGRYESGVTETFRACLNSEATVLDIGANIGWYTLLAAQTLERGGRVISIEPEPRNFRLLSESVRKNGFNNVALIQSAVADFDGELALYLSKTNTGGHSIAFQGDVSVNVPCFTIDTLLAHRGIDTVDVVKIDVEGAEPRVIRGSPRTFFGRTPPRVIMEYSPTVWRNEPDLLKQLYTHFGVYELRGRIGRWHPRRPEDLSPAHQSMLYLVPFDLSA
jgi:FkbM family methyltransferase